MGNRAVITASKLKDSGLGIYLHWNGGIESVVAFLDVAKFMRYRSPDQDESYGMARLCGLIFNFVGVRGDTGIGINDLSKLDCDNYDNGVFVIGGDWEIIDRWGHGSSPFTREDVEAARMSDDYKRIVEEVIVSLDRTESTV